MAINNDGLNQKNQRASPKTGESPKAKAGKTAVTSVTEAKTIKDTQSYLELSPEMDLNPYMEMDLEGNLKYQNPACKRLFPDLTKLGLNHLFFANWVRVAKKLKANGGVQPVVCEVAIGKLLLEQSYSMLSENLMSISCREITPWEKTARESRLREEMLDACSDSMILTDSEGNPVYLNEAACRAHGYSREEMMRINIRSLVVPEVASSLQPMTIEEIKKGGIIFQSAHYRKDGSILPLEINARVFEWRGDSHLLSVCRDITKRKQAEEALKKSEDNFHNSLENSPLGVRIVDEEGETLYANKAILDIYGYKNLEEFHAMPVKYRYTPESYSEFLLRMEKRRHHEPIQDNYEVSIVRKDGKVRQLQAMRKSVLWGGKQQYQTFYVDITERKQAETALKASEQNFRNSLDNSSMGTYIVDADKHILYANKAFLDIFGYKTIEEAETTPPAEFYTPASYADFVLRMEKELRGEPIPVKAEVDISDKGGSIRHLQVFRREVIWDGKQRHQVLFNDITEHKQMEEALKVSEQNFRNSLDSSFLGVYIVNDERNTIYANKVLLDIFGYENNEDVKASPPHEHYTPDSYTDYLQRNELQSRGEPTPTQFEIDIIRKNGGVRHLQASRYELFWDGMKRYEVLYNDVTERKRAQEALMVSEIRYRRIFESSKDGILIIDENTGLVTDANPYLIDLLGLSQNKFIGRELWEIGVFKEIAPDKARFQELLKKGYVRYEDLPLKTAEGKQIYVEFVSNVYEVEHLKVIQCNIRNITDRKEAEKEKQQLQEKAQVASRLAAIGEMAAGIAHEINNPLTGILGYSQTLLGKENIPETVKGDLKLIAESSQRVADIVKRLLTFARQSKPIKTRVDLNELISNTLKLREYVLKTANIEVISRFDPELPLSVADPGQLQQVFLNLIINAEQAMKEIHGKGTLTITTEKKGGNIRVLVQDDGPGITKENMKRLFEPFFTTKAPGEGTGLGLSLSHSIILQHDGKMTVESEFGNGATFIVELPIVECQPAKTEIPNTTSIVESSVTKKGRALVVDDEAVVRGVLQKVLTRMGHSVDITADARIALNKLNTGVNYDVIFTDVRMPGMSGIELYTRIIEKRPEMKNRIIFITGDVMGGDIKTFLNQNNLQYLAKPFDVEALKEKIDLIMTID